MSTNRTPSTSTASADNTTLDNAVAKAKQPDVYYGDRTMLETWLLQLDLYFFVSKKELRD